MLELDPLQLVSAPEDQVQNKRKPNLSQDKLLLLGSPESVETREASSPNFPRVDQ